MKRSNGGKIMNKRNLKTLIALLLAACMLLSGIGAFAAPTVQVTEPAPGEAVVDITGIASGTDSGADHALEVTAYYDDNTHDEGVTVQVGGEYVPNLVDPADYQKASDALENAQTVTVNVSGDVSADAKGDHAEATGVHANAMVDGATVDVTVQGDISAKAKSESWGNDTYGAQLSADGGEVSLKANDITSAADGADMSAYGVQANGSDGGTANVETGNITVSSELEEAYGIYLSNDNWEGKPSGTVKATVNGDINVSTEQVNRGFGVYAYGTKDGSISAQVNGEINIDTKGEQGESYGVNADQGRKGQVDVKVDGDVNVTSACSIKSADPDPASESIGVGSTASWDDAVANVDVNGNVTVTNAGHDARGIDAVSGGGTVNINVNGDISATGGMTGVGINAYITEQDGYDDPVTGEWVEEQSQGGHSNVKVKGNVTASVADDGFYARGISALSNNGGAIEVGVLGDVTAKGKEAVGLQFTKTEGSDLTVLVDGTLSGDKVAIFAEGSTMYNGEKIDNNDPTTAKICVWKAEEKNGQIAQINKTVITFEDNPEYDAALQPDDANGYYKKLEDGEPRIYGYEEVDRIADEATQAAYDALESDEERLAFDWESYRNSVMDEWEQYWINPHLNYSKTVEIDKDASTQFEKTALWYIIKVAADFQNTLTAAGTNTYTYDGTTYDLAHQDENVTGTYRINADEEGLDGVYYNADDKIEAKAGEWKDNGDGSFWVKMLRGGAMMLGLKTHRHQKTAREVAGSRVAPTCTAAGGYDEETYCTVCGKVFKTEHKTVAALGHTGGEPVRENIVAARAGVAGGYDEVVYCDVCGEELSRTHVDVPALPVPAVEPAAPAEPVTPMELVYEPVDELHGVKPADHPAADEAMAAVGAALDGEDVTVEIPGVEKLLDAEELQQFNTLPVKDRLLVVLSALGFANETLSDIGGMSEDAQALADTVAERMAQLPEDEKQALLQTMAEAFPKGAVTIDGQTYDSFSIDLVIDRAGEKTYERYTFYDDNGAWKLYGIEQGEYRPVEA